jgi:hypothetical protein
MKRMQIISLAAAFACTMICEEAYSQVSQDERGPLCIHFSGDSRDLLVELRKEITLSGTTPLTLCNLEQGVDYGFTVRGRGFEVRRGRLAIDENGLLSVSGNRLVTFAGNIIPGYGSIRAERENSGWSDMISIAVSGLITLKEYKEYNHIENRYTNLMEQLDAADNVDDKQRITIDAHTTSRDLNVQNTHVKRCLAFTGYMYAFQLIDPWIVGNPPKARVTSGGSVVELEGSGSSVAKAALLSLFRPGRGQFYQAKRSRGLFFSLTSMASVLFALDYLNKYEEAVNAYEINLEYYDLAETVEDKEYYSERSSEYWADVDKTRGWRNISYGVAAGIWAAGIIDTFIPGRDDAPPSDLSFSVGPTHASLVYRF